MKKGKQVASYVPKEDFPKAKACFYAFPTRGSMSDDDDDDDDISK